MSHRKTTKLYFYTLVSFLSRPAGCSFMFLIQRRNQFSSLPKITYNSFNHLGFIIITFIEKYVSENCFGKISFSTEIHHMVLPWVSLSPALLLDGLSLTELWTSSSLRRLSFLLSIFSKTFWKKIYNFTLFSYGTWTTFFLELFYHSNGVKLTVSVSACWQMFL